MLNEDLLVNDDHRDVYDELVVSIEAKAHRLNLLIAVCDDASFRDEIIAQYEAELQPLFPTYRVTLARGEPSLTAAISQLVKNEEYLRQHKPAVITVTGAEQLYFLPLGKERSEQDIFFGYLQWTREALREFPFAIVLWVTNQILINLINKAPDFWSWRNGVFRFVSRRKNSISGKELEPIRFAFNSHEIPDFDDDNPYLLPIEDLKKFIQDAEQQSKKDTSLATLYFSLGNIYIKRLQRGECQDYQKEQELAIEYLSKAVELQKQLGLEKDLPSSLNNLALLYDSQGRYDQAEPLFLQALELRKRLLGEDHPHVAQSLNNLAFLYYSQGLYDQAEPLFLQALELRKRLLGDNHPDVASSLHNLASLYDSQGLYDQAEPLYLQALELCQRLLGDNHPDVAQSLNNLASLYESQGRYDQAEPLLLQALELRKRLLGDNHPDVATSLNNLANLYSDQGRYDQAESLLLQALELRKRLLGENHPDVATSLNNLAYLYFSQGRYDQAEPLFLQALELCKRLLGDNHPNTITVRKNWEACRQQN